MNPETAEMEQRAQRLEEAATWLQRLHDRNADDSLIDAWLEWCQRDPRNQLAFDDLAVVWDASEGLGNEVVRQESTEQAVATVPDTREEFLAAAPPAVFAQPKIDAIGPARRRYFAMAASLAGLGLAGVLAGAWWLDRPTPDPARVTHLSSPVGMNSAHRLSDGSELELGAGSQVSVRMDAAARRVELHQGEVFVVVQKDVLRPFSVEAGRLQVIATGTEFNVLRTAERTTVTVAEGSVDAKYEGQDSETPQVSLHSSQQLVYTHATQRVTVQQADPAEAIAWRSGNLNFRQEPLSEVVAKVNRYSGQPIIIEDPEVGKLPFTGTARADRIHGWLQGLPHIFPVSIKELPDGGYQIAPDNRTD